MFCEELFTGDRVTAFDGDDGEMWSGTVIYGGKNEAQIQRDDDMEGVGEEYEGLQLWKIIIKNEYKSKRWDPQDETYEIGYIERTNIRNVDNWKKQLGD